MVGRIQYGRMGQGQATEHDARLDINGLYEDEIKKVNQKWSELNASLAEALSKSSSSNWYGRETQIISDIREEMKALSGREQDLRKEQRVIATSREYQTVQAKLYADSFVNAVTKYNEYFAKSLTNGIPRSEVDGALEHIISNEVASKKDPTSGKPNIGEQIKVLETVINSAIPQPVKEKFKPALETLRAESKKAKKKNSLENINGRSILLGGEDGFLNLKGYLESKVNSSGEDKDPITDPKEQKEIVDGILDKYWNETKDKSEALKNITQLVGLPDDVKQGYIDKYQGLRARKEGFVDQYTKSRDFAELLEDLANGDDMNTVRGKLFNKLGELESSGLIGESEVDAVVRDFERVAEKNILLEKQRSEYLLRLRKQVRHRINSAGIGKANLDPIALIKTIADVGNTDLKISEQEQLDMATSAIESEMERAKQEQDAKNEIQNVELKKPNFAVKFMEGLTSIFSKSIRYRTEQSRKDLEFQMQQARNLLTQAKQLPSPKEREQALAQVVKVKDFIAKMKSDYQTSRYMYHKGVVSMG